MNFVEPIKNPTTVRDMVAYLKERSMRDYMMFVIGIYSGLRISDILSLRVVDVRNKSQIVLREKKTGKQKFFEINPSVKKALNEYLSSESFTDEDYLIRSSRKSNRPLSRSRAYEIIRKLGKAFNIDNLGTHTLRKTFGYHFYQQTKDVVILQKIFNHSHPSITLRYIGIEQESLNEAVRKFKIW